MANNPQTTLTKADIKAIEKFKRWVQKNVVEPMDRKEKEILYGKR